MKAHIPRPHPPIWLRFLVGLLVLGAILALSAVKLANDPPIPNHCLGSDAANRWCVPNE